MNPGVLVDSSITNNADLLLQSVKGRGLPLTDSNFSIQQIVELAPRTVDFKFRLIQ